MRSILENIHKAAHDTAQFMEGEVRERALASGWKPEVVDNLHVRFHNNKFSVFVHDKFVGDALTHEFGNETKRPTAVLRKYGNNTGKASANFVANLDKRMGGN